MTSDDARSIVTTLPGATEGAHHDHPDFRKNGKIFATLWPDEQRSVIRLEPEHAAGLEASEPRKFKIVSHGGGMGWVSADLRTLEPEEYRALVEIAWGLVPTA